MSFTGKATYAELYPAVSSCDVCDDVSGTTYNSGSVFLDTDTEDGFYPELYLLVRVSEYDFMLVAVNDGNRWSNTPIPVPINASCAEHDFIVHAGGDFRFIGMAEDVLDVSNQAHRIIEEIKKAA